MKIKTKIRHFTPRPGIETKLQIFESGCRFSNITNLSRTANNNQLMNVHLSDTRRQNKSQLQHAQKRSKIAQNGLAKV